MLDPIIVFLLISRLLDWHGGRRPAAHLCLLHLWLPLQVSVFLQNGPQVNVSSPIPLPWQSYCHYWCTNYSNDIWIELKLFFLTLKFNSITYLLLISASSKHQVYPNHSRSNREHVQITLFSNSTFLTKNIVLLFTFLQVSPYCSNISLIKIGSKFKNIQIVEEKNCPTMLQLASGLSSIFFLGFFFRSLILTSPITRRFNKLSLLLQRTDFKIDISHYPQFFSGVHALP